MQITPLLALVMLCTARSLRELVVQAVRRPAAEWFSESSQVAVIGPQCGENKACAPIVGKEFCGHKSATARLCSLS